MENLLLYGDGIADAPELFHLEETYHGAAYRNAVLVHYELSEYQRPEVNRRTRRAICRETHKDEHNASCYTKENEDAWNRTQLV